MQYIDCASAYRTSLRVGLGACDLVWMADASCGMESSSPRWAPHRNLIIMHVTIIVDPGRGTSRSWTRSSTTMLNHSKGRWI